MDAYPVKRLKMGFPRAAHGLRPWGVEKGWQWPRVAARTSRPEQRELSVKTNPGNGIPPPTPSLWSWSWSS